MISGNDVDACVLQQSQSSYTAPPQLPTNSIGPHSNHDGLHGIQMVDSGSAPMRWLPDTYCT
jgi:hypothetical protein